MAGVEAEAVVAVVGGAVVGGAAAVEVVGDHPAPVDPDRGQDILDQAAPHPTEDTVAAPLRVGDNTVKTQSTSDNRSL